MIISLEFNQPLSYNVKCYSYYHGWNCGCFDQTKLKDAWDHYLKAGKLTSEMKVNVVRLYERGFYKKATEVDFKMPQFD